MIYNQPKLNMAGKLHPDKRSVIYGEWRVVYDILQREADAVTAQLRDKAREGEIVRPVTVPEIIRRLTLKEANEILVKRGEKTIDLDSSSSPSLHRGERFSKKDGTLVLEERFSTRKKETVELPAGVTAEAFKAMFAMMQKAMEENSKGKAA